MSSRSSHRAQPSLASGEKESVYPAGVEHKVTVSGGGGSLEGLSSAILRLRGVLRMNRGGGGCEESRGCSAEKILYDYPISPLR